MQRQRGQRGHMTAVYFVMPPLSPPALRGGFFPGAIRVACGFAGRATRSTLRVRTGQCG